MTKNKITVSFCPYQGGDYDFFIEDAASGESICLSGKTTDLPEGAEKLLARIAPPCVMSAYEELTTDEAA